MQLFKSVVFWFDRHIICTPYLTIRWLIRVEFRVNRLMLPVTSTPRHPGLNCLLNSSWWAFHKFFMIICAKWNASNSKSFLRFLINNCIQKMHNKVPHHKIYYWELCWKINKKKLLWAEIHMIYLFINFSISWFFPASDF